MLPVAIFRHAALEGPGFLAGLLDDRQIPWQLIDVDAGAALPSSADAYSGLLLMGGPMSANDDSSWIVQELNLIRNAVARDIPVMGVCLGGQLMSKALCGVVSQNPVVEIGWGDVEVADNDIARRWFGDTQAFAAFHWHGETFTLPDGATRLLSGAHCANQGYAIGPHLALQCHIEMTDGMIAAWCAAGAAEIKAGRNSPAVQSAEQMRQQAAVKLPQLHSVAERLYAHWIAGLNPES